MKDEKNTRDTVAVIASIIFVLGGFIGLHYDWTGYVLLFPLGWALLGLLLDVIINGGGNRESIGNATCGVLILLNIASVMIHRDTLFIVGRIVCCFGLVIAIVRTTKNSEESTRKELRAEIETLEKRNIQLEEDINVLVKHNKV